MPEQVHLLPQPQQQPAVRECGLTYGVALQLVLPGQRSGKYASSRGIFWFGSCLAACEMRCSNTPDHRTGTFIPQIISRAHLHLIGPESGIH